MNFEDRPMPLLKIQTNYHEIPSSNLKTLQDEGAKILAEEIGKSLDFVMVLVEVGKSISFGGQAEQGTAFLEIKNVGSLAPELTHSISVRLCALLEDSLNISPDRCYLEFQESERHMWGWNGKTFGS